MIRPIKWTAFVVFGALAVIFIGCDADSIVSTETMSDDQEAQYAAVEKYGSSNGAVNLPFKSRFMTTGQPSGDYRGSCGDRPFPPYNQAIQNGSGEATHLGRFSVYGTFCMDITPFMDDGALTGDESAPYDNGWFVLVAANGDSLWLSIEGEVLPSDDPRYTGEFFSPMYVEGGTGRFEGASGEGMTKNYILPGFPTEVIHEWDGVLILPKND
jgi:hypothetical protein